jgi:hypothetical protein
MPGTQFVPGAGGGGFSRFSPKMPVASLYGAALNCNLTTGGKIGAGTATDDTAALNATIRGATAMTPVYLIIDGSASSETLLLPVLGNVSIEGIGWDSGIFTKSVRTAALSIITAKMLSYSIRDHQHPQRGGKTSVSQTSESAVTVGTEQMAIVQAVTLATLSIRRALVPLVSTWSRSTMWISTTYAWTISGCMRFA